jgi:hypothetical protein
MGRDLQPGEQVEVWSYLTDKDHNLTPLEIQNLRRALAEYALIAMLGILVYFIRPGDDEDKEQVGEARWMALYLAVRLKKELSVYSILEGPEELLKLFRTPSALNSFILRLAKVVQQAFTDPLERYERKSGKFEKGDLKLWAYIRKLFGNLGGTFPFGIFGTSPIDTQQATENLEKPIF